MAKKPVKKAHKPSPKTFNIIAKRVHKFSKKQKLDWSWQEAQKFTSKNIFKTFKGIPKSKLKVTKIDDLVDSVLKLGVTPNAPESVNQTDIDCADVFEIPDTLLEPINWFQIEDILYLFPSNLNVRISISGVVDTGIIKMQSAPDPKVLREEMRKNRFGSDEIISFERLVKPNRKDDKIKCSYFILVYLESAKPDVSDCIIPEEVFVQEKDISSKAKDELTKKQQELEKKRAIQTKKEVHGKERPKGVEESPADKTKSTEEAVSAEETKTDIAGEREHQLNLTIDKLKGFYDSKLITKKEFQKQLAIIISKFEKGGEI